MFCGKCGKNIPDDSIFCKFCGASIEPISSDSSSKTDSNSSFTDKPNKCPVCGQLLESYQVKCSACGAEIRRNDTAGSISSFSKEIQAINDQLITPSLFRKDNVLLIRQKKVDLIRNFPIPNSAEDIIEFMFLAMSNINSDGSDDEFNKAWEGKMDQAYQKAKFTMQDSPLFVRIQSLYDQFISDKDSRKKKQTKTYILGAIGIILLYVVLFALIKFMQ